MDPNQDQPLKITNNGQMNEVVTNGENVAEETSGCRPAPAQSQEASAPVPHHPVREQDAAVHVTHSLKWQWNKNSYTITCNNARGVESALKKSSQYKEIAKKNKNKELVIMRAGKAISSHFPCSLVKNEQLTLKYFKAANTPRQLAGGIDHCQRKRPSSDLVMFHLLTKGGSSVRRIMRNSELEKKNIDRITIYAYKGEKVKYALKRDGRLMDIVFKKNCALSNTNTEETTEMSDLVHDHDGETFMIKLLDMCSPPESQPDGLEEISTVQLEPQRSDSEGNPGPPQPSDTTESVNVNTPENKATLDGKKPPDMFHEILHSKQTLMDLSTDLTKMLKGMSNQRVPSVSRVRNLLRVEYSKNDEACREVRTMKTLMDLSNSVCQVRINDRAEGSGFLLFDKFVLTNGHVANSFYNENTQQLSQGVTVHFSFESLAEMAPGAAVEEVVGFEYCKSGQMRDWALMRIRTDQNLPDGLLTRLGDLPKRGGICIIGHPDGGVKMIDPCFIIPNENHQQVVEKHERKNPQGVWPLNRDYKNGENIQLITSLFFKDVKNDKTYSQALHYDTCFYFGSSGSPVFDMDCNVVAMHRGGYTYRNAKNEMHSVVEYGCPLYAVIDHIIVHMVEKGKADVLKGLLACSDERHRPQMIAYLKQLVGSKGNWNEFSELFSQEEVSVPMDED